MCSFSQSSSLRAEKVNSSASLSAICSADARSSDIHAAEPTGKREAARNAAIFVDQNNANEGSSATLVDVCDFLKLLTHC
jgi:hypothetical protein